jgi:hypothetical protein
MEASDEGTRMREILEAVLQEHVIFETYEEWFREAADEVEDALGTEGETAVPPWEEVRERVRRHVLLHLAERTTGEVSDAMRSVARECGKRGDEG